MEEIENQKWYCEKCRVRGEVEYEKGLDVMSVANRIGAAHEKASPGCSAVTNRLRVLNESRMTRADWESFNLITPASV